MWPRPSALNLDSTVHGSFTGHQFIFISQFHSLLLLSSIRNVQKMWFRAADKYSEAFNLYMDCYSRAGQIAKNMHWKTNMEEKSCPVQIVCNRKQAFFHNSQVSSLSPSVTMHLRGAFVLEIPEYNFLEGIRWNLWRYVTVPQYEF